MNRTEKLNEIVEKYKNTKICTKCNKEIPVYYGYMVKPFRDFYYCQECLNELRKETFKKYGHY